MATNSGAEAYRGMFASKRRTRPPPLIGGDTLASLHELALRVVLQQIDASCPADAPMDDAMMMAGNLAEWPAATYEWVLPRVANPRLIAACRNFGLPNDHSPCAAALRSAASDAVLEASIRREENRYRARRSAGNDEGADEVCACPLIECFSGDWGELLSATVPPSLPPKQQIFAHERAYCAAPLGTPALEKDLAGFEANFDCFTGGLLVGLSWDNVIAAGGSVLACALPCTPPPSVARLGR